MMEQSKAQVFASVWDALEDTPAAAANMQLRSELLSAVQQVVASWNATPDEALTRLGLTRPRLDDLLRGRINEFSLDVLIGLAARAGLAVRLEISHSIAAA